MGARVAFSLPFADAVRGGGSIEDVRGFLVGGGGERDIELDASDGRTFC